MPLFRKMIIAMMSVCQSDGASESIRTLNDRGASASIRILRKSAALATNLMQNTQLSRHSAVLAHIHDPQNNL
ncbi:MAG: hypothetical protein AAF074_20645, partial [Pseudomonadota bacterium]